jgi:hypothetical protein
MSSCFDINTTRGCTKQLDNVLLHGRFEASDLGAFQNQGNIHISNLVSVTCHDLIGVLHKLGRVAAPPSRISVLKDLTDVRQSESSKNSVDNGMVYDVSVGMSDYT